MPDEKRIEALLARHNGLKPLEHEHLNPVQAISRFAGPCLRQFKRPGSAGFPYETCRAEPDQSIWSRLRRVPRTPKHPLTTKPCRGGSHNGETALRTRLTADRGVAMPQS